MYYKIKNFEKTKIKKYDLNYFFKFLSSIFSIKYYRKNYFLMLKLFVIYLPMMIYTINVLSNLTHRKKHELFK